ncbi:hypothetical protein KC316_g15702 [Hortaea werneckii]|nr:hypothetical protein KC324_g14478 [Hortaea werneckii]KAI7539298.1 hypothetical protein KC316_g15702 [Hortaea werneckii]
MHLGLEKKVVLVTGGTKGIGRTIVRHFLQEGAIVHFCSRTQDEVDAANKALAKEFSAKQVLGVVVDVANRRSSRPGWQPAPRNPDASTS